MATDGPASGGPLFVCLGDVMVDVVAHLRQALAHGSDSPAPIRMEQGGSAANTAAWLAAAGQAVAFVGKVGTDPAGDAAVRDLERLGVRPYVARHPSSPTGTCIVLVSVDGERTMIPDAGANTTLDRADLPEDLFGPQAHLHLSGYSLLNEGSRAAAIDAVALARGAGATVSVDPSSSGPLAAVGPQTFLSWVGGCDSLLANADEARVLTGIRDPGAAAQTLTTAFAEVVVTLGSQGALWAGRGTHSVVSVDAPPVEVVDTTGAGDAFAAGWLPAALAGADPAQALSAGCALAARAVGRAGGRPS